MVKFIAPLAFILLTSCVHNEKYDDVGINNNAKPIELYLTIKNLQRTIDAVNILSANTSLPAFKKTEINIYTTIDETHSGSGSLIVSVRHEGKTTKNNSITLVLVPNGEKLA